MCSISRRGPRAHCTSSCASPAAQAHHERVPRISVAPLMPHTSEMLGVMQVRPVSLASPVCAASAHACSLNLRLGPIGRLFGGSWSAVAPA